MPRQNNGTYTLPPNTTAVAGQTISPSAYDAFLADLTNEIGNSVDRLGRGAMNASLNMGTNTIENVLKGSNPTSAANRADVAAVTTSIQTNAAIIGANVGGSPNALTATFTPAITSLVTGLKVLVRNSQNGNTSGAVTFQADPSVAAVPMVKGLNLPLAPNDTGQGGYWMELLYDAGFGGWILLNPFNLSGRDTIGMIAPFASASQIGGNWLLCNGQAISRNLYNDLFYLIGGNYGGGDGSTTFNVPDLRGRFLRVQDAGANIDPNRGIGTEQLDQIQEHEHNFSYVGSNYYNQVSGSAPGASSPATKTGVTSSIASGARVGSETRPRNIALPFFIKAA